MTPLAERIERFGRWLMWAALALFVGVLALGALRRLPLDDVLMVAISQMVSMVPEGLPVAMTIALAVGMQRMAERGAIVRRLGAVETLGSTSVICSDKTGTLTRNEMTASALWLPGGIEVNVQGSGYAPHGALSAIAAGAGAVAARRRAVQRRPAAAARGRAHRLARVGRPHRRRAEGAGVEGRARSRGAGARGTARSRMAVRCRHQADGHAPPHRRRTAPGVDQRRAGGGAAAVCGRWRPGAARRARGGRRDGRTRLACARVRGGRRRPARCASRCRRAGRPRAPARPDRRDRPAAARGEGRRGVVPRRRRAAGDGHRRPQADRPGDRARARHRARRRPRARRRRTGAPGRDRAATPRSSASPSSHACTRRRSCASCRRCRHAARWSR